MPIHDYDVVNAAGAAFRADLNNALLAIVSQNSSATEPTTMFAYQFWADTTTGILKQRNAANTAWIDILTLSTGKVALAVAADTATTATNQSGGTVAATTITASSTIIGSSSVKGATVTGTSSSAAIVGTASGSGDGVYGNSATGKSVNGASTSGYGVFGQSDSGDGVFGASTSGYGMVVQGGLIPSPARAAFRIVPQSAQPTGANAVGDIYVTSAGVLKICTVAGTPGTWVSVGAQV